MYFPRHFVAYQTSQCPAKSRNSGLVLKFQDQRADNKLYLAAADTFTALTCTVNFLTFTAFLIRGLAVYPHFVAYSQNRFQNQGRIGFSCHCRDYKELTDGVGEGGIVHAGSKVTVSEFDREGLVVLFT